MLPLLGLTTRGLVCRLRRALYGLKQAPRAWFERFSFTLIAAGFQPSPHDPALFVHSSSRGRTLQLLYVDDMIITGDDPSHVEFVKHHLQQQFQMTDLGQLSYFLGLEVLLLIVDFSSPSSLVLLISWLGLFFLIPALWLLL